ncbi:MAG: hypothetical protein A3E07_01945 [Candidatus Wildermuthbacteria bacterium RIFCSPHIGHO2_12_FULL_45_9]|uniref:Phage holin family protein n=1 Tax=Candidatus Wildermuthbacteria bacterium RIFCSPHIGHO2_02_FULL_45_25 TaxID=1802450 RepID=A0A1G2R402_9BACT|nr:MAG: hypothetical protein A2748_01530 [Candidatus Wildermuthbacteria bacterium RIFCSPHIGHO2_01_FULL_45_20]OHA67457.1 MAG: hypothetical protein A3C04_00840 [Candidatus Wildermuthbacteria bacterium RIFCSPHIGHO2_02_FULL_45_25]OHA72349.1 MAG: hypothetical protein A3E07_01945 [Candidatus Wildermuthbacteria bacterium RIFCSPHIGHO2_12_FULL_45_9]
MFLSRILFHIIAGIVGLWIAIHFIDGVSFSGHLQTLLIMGAVLGIMNAILKPILNLITLPIRLLTLGLSGLIINLVFVWALEIFFPEFQISGLIPLFWTTLVVWAVSIPISLLMRGKI